MEKVSFRSSHWYVWVKLGLVAVVLGLFSGCEAVKWAAYTTAPQTEKVSAECKLLQNQTVLVYAWAPPEVLWDYPKIRLNLSAYVSEYLRQHVEEIEVINYYRVEKYVEKQNVFEIDPVELGERFRADMVLQLDVYKFSIRDPGRAHLYRGRLASSVEVHDLTSPEEPERIQLEDVEVTYPEEKAIGFSNVRPEQVRQGTYELFAVEVGKKFHDHEKPFE